MTFPPALRRLGTSTPATTIQIAQIEVVPMASALGFKGPLPISYFVRDEFQSLGEAGLADDTRDLCISVLFSIEPAKNGTGIMTTRTVVRR